MPTNRKVIDFKIHNLTEEQFQELKEAGQIDPNAIYCTPDETVANFEAVNARIDETNKKLNTFESGVNETVGVINTTIVNVDKKVDEAIQTEQQHNIEINARVDETVANFEELNERIDTVNERIDTANEQINTKQDVATAINYGHVTNCITEIPQDIKLELNNGALTLKAGSKVYVPNGAGVFNEIVRDSDLVYNFGTPSNGQYLIFNSQYFYMLSNCVSGATDSKAGQGYHSWYDTTNNLVKQYWADGNTLAKTDSLPVAIVTISGGVITSIDQIFNGFGYIGSTVFALPGVKGLIPNGRNADGSLNNIEITTPTIKTMTMASYMASRNGAPLTIFANNELGGMDINQNSWGTVNKLSDIVRPSYYACYYCLEDNLVHYFNGSGNESIRQLAFIGSFNVSSNNKITHFTSKTVFHAVDYNDLISKNAIAMAAPAGIVAAFAGSIPPAGWLKCDGSAISRTTYAKLFTAIGSLYGTGDGSTTFNLPDLTGRVPLGMFGEYIGKSTNGVLPNITGTWQDFDNNHTWGGPTGAFSASAAANAGGIGSGYNMYKRTMDFNAARSNSMYGNGWFSGEKVIPASVGMTYCIKY